MPDMMLRYGWAFVLVVMLLNVPLLWLRVRPHIAANPELATGYRRLFQGFAFWISLPWLVMGFGCVIGGITFLHYFRPLTGGPFVWAFWVVIFAEFLLLGYWTLFRDGAETLVRYPGVITFRTASVTRMKWWVGVAVVFAIVWNAGVLVWLA